MTLLQKFHWLDNRIYKLNTGFERSMKIDNLDAAILSINITAQSMHLENERRGVADAIITQERIGQ